MSPRRKYMDACKFPRMPPRYAVRRLILLVGEGKKTEPNYFQALERDRGASSGFHLEIKAAEGSSPKHCINTALQEIGSARRRHQEYDEVWCVFDVESAPNAASLAKALATARKNGIKTCLSNPSFEVWLIAHFERTSKSFIDAKAAQHHLSVHWVKACAQPYDKADARVYEGVRALTETAINNAREVHLKDHRGGNVEACNSSTEVYRLVAMLLTKT